jgi:hypothetical protein
MNTNKELGISCTNDIVRMTLLELNASKEFLLQKAKEIDDKDTEICRMLEFTDKGKIVEEYTDIYKLHREMYSVYVRANSAAKEINERIKKIKKNINNKKQ